MGDHPGGWFIQMWQNLARSLLVPLDVILLYHTTTVNVPLYFLDTRTNETHKAIYWGSMLPKNWQINVQKSSSLKIVIIMVVSERLSYEKWCCNESCIDRELGSFTSYRRYFEVVILVKISVFMYYISRIFRSEGSSRTCTRGNCWKVVHTKSVNIWQSC